MIFSFFKKSHQQNSEYFYGLFLKETQGTVFLIEKNINGVFLKDFLDFFYTNGWENLVEDIDEKLYQLEKKYQEIEVSKTIFFLYSHLIDENLNKIKNPYLSKIKSILKNLDLKPLGYIECYEGISFYLEKKQGSFLNNIILEIDLKQLTIFIFKNGKIIFRKTIARTENIIDDIEFCFSSLKNFDNRGFLPGKIIIYDSEDLDKIGEKIISYKWNEEYFIQQPKVEIITKERVFNSLIDVFSKQISYVINDNNNFNDKDHIKEKKDINQSSFGFFIGQDIAKKENANIENNQEYPKTKNNFKINFNFSSFFNFFSKFNFPKINSFLKIKEKSLLIIGFLFIFLVIFINEYFFHKAELTLYLPAQKIEKQQEFLIDYKIASSSSNFKETIATSGKKDVGEKARGIITIHNFDDKEKSFSKGEIVESSGIKFVLDNDVKVASSTIAADGSAKLPGKTNVSITAENIGEEGNLPKGSRFKIDDLSTNLYFAINNENLTGGTKKTVKVASKNDFETLENKILDRAKKEISLPNLNKDYAVINNLSEIKIVNSKYSKEIGEEGDSLTTEAKVLANFYFYNKNDLKNKILNLLKKDLKKDFSLAENNINYQIKNVKKENNQLNITLNIKAKGLLTVDFNRLKKQLLAKNLNKAKLILKENYQIDGFNVVFNQPIFIFKNYFPIFEKNIKIRISSL